TVAKAHSLAAIAAYALESAGIEDEAFDNEKNNAIRKNIIFDAEREGVTDRLEEEGIWYMPLKGIIIKDMYPAIGMRQMCDNDILFDKRYRDRLVMIMEQQGFSLNKEDTSHDIVFYKEPVCNFEMHIELFGGGNFYQLNSFFEEIAENRVIKDEDNKFGYHLSDEDYYLYMIAHEFKHFTLGGVGLRSFVDTYIYLENKKATLDRDYISEQVKLMGMEDFESKNREIAYKLFEGRRLSDDEREMFDYCVFSDSYGKLKNRVTNRYNKNSKSKLRYIKSRLILPDEMVKYTFPYFYEHKYLMPLLPIYRMFMGLFKARKRMFSEIRMLMHIK
nr:nucleotidyltransferase family protein [Ruminococcus sp.]